MKNWKFKYIYNNSLRMLDLILLFGTVLAAILAGSVFWPVAVGLTLLFMMHIFLYGQKEIKGKFLNHWVWFVAAGICFTAAIMHDSIFISFLFLFFCTHFVVRNYVE